MRPKFLDSKSIIQIFEETLAELWQAIKRYFWEITRFAVTPFREFIATYRLKHTGVKVSKETQEKAKKICKKIKKDLEE